MPDFLDFIKDSPIVAHNADFDMGFLEIKLPRINIDVPRNQIWDNLKLGVLLYPEMQSFALEYLADFFQIPFKKTHRASDDCIATGQLFVTFLRDAPSVWDRDFWVWITENCLAGTDLGNILKTIFHHPDFKKFASLNAKSQKKKPSSIPESTLVKNIKPGRSPDDFLIRISTADSDNPDLILANKKLYRESRRHLFTFPAVQYPGDFWGVDKKWANIRERSANLVLYPGRERILCKKLLNIFIEGCRDNPLSLKPFEIAVLNSFAQTSDYGNFSSLSWWIWNNLPGLAESISFISAANCEHENCDFRDKCFYIETLKAAKTAEFLGFPFRVLKEEEQIPRAENIPSKIDLTVFAAEGIFRDNLVGGIHSFVLHHVQILMDRIIKLSPAQTSEKLKKQKQLADETIDILLHLTENLISTAGHNRLQKGKRFFLFVTENIVGESFELMNELKRLSSCTMGFVNLIPADHGQISFLTPMLKKIAVRLDKAIKKMQKDELVLCLDIIENADNKNCRFLFFQHILDKTFLNYPGETERYFFITHHLCNNLNWEKYLDLIGRDSNHYNYLDIAPSIPPGNKIFLSQPVRDDSSFSKKRIMNIKGDAINDIILRYPGRSLVIVRGSQELLNFKYRLAPKLKESGYWPLFQKQDGPKGLLIKEFAKHMNVVFFGLTDLFEDIHQFESSPDNLILESLHLTSLQDPIEYFVKMEMENAGLDYISEYLEPKVHFTLTKSLRRWKNYLEGRGRIFILDEHMQESDYGASFLNELEGERQYL